MATVEFRWTEERVDNLIALLDEIPCLYNTKLRDYSEIRRPSTR